MAIAVVLAFACNNNIAPSNTPYLNKEIINKKGSTILIGHTAPYMFKQGSNAEWFYKYYNEHFVDSSSIAALQKLLSNTTMEIFLGSWCGDSKREVPRMLKILDSLHYDTSRIKLILVDFTVEHYKQSPQHEERNKNIHHVPTFIVYENNKEMGRIVESPVVSLEKDLLSIVTKEKYIPKYGAILEWQKIINRNKLRSEKEIQSIAANLKPLCASAGEFNALGYMLYAQERKAEAGNVFLLNTYLFPERAGTHDSLGEYYFLTGDKVAARKCYERVLQLKPNDANAKKMLEQL